ncbi:response regulator transcription factor [uncultured Pseudoramibacter sp.]|uniref:response regulator transcription factor n=1 Tax=uncultured Pseudoramibacter sp. TaxID=1623493 RepID=UPI0025F5A6FB|nr:response regulator transcription factor [uncultured Pseudoramibacter sp.]
MQQRILIVEDDPLIADLERDYLEAAGYEVEIASDGETGLELAQAEKWDLFLLDVMLPGMNGFNICRTIRESSNTPIILVTAKKTDVDKIRGLGLGADDYIVKPFSPSEMVARVKAHIAIHERLKSGNTPVHHQIAVKDLVIDTDAHRVSVRGKEVSLKNKEYELLVFLASNPDIVFSKETLFDRIWGMDAMGDTATVTVHINRIREKIEIDSSHPEYIQTVWGAGYRFSVV